jgi:hypothetical protein
MSEEEQAIERVFAVMKADPEYKSIMDDMVKDLVVFGFVTAESQVKLIDFQSKYVNYGG